MPFLRKCVAFCLFVLALTAFAQETREGRLLRFPDICKDKVTFVYAGDDTIEDLSNSRSQ